ncbi:otoferlin-like [Bacillus rossius redtenbacheri]|uniref:otoferlin-like n=1 Tax=Bacillus rossius redtenbacheri TaxID=93214 RepID=UPI002FDEE7A0
MQQEQTIEQNLMVSTTLLNEWKRASLCLRVYRADGIPSVYNGLDLSVRAYFSGRKAETSRCRMKHNSVTWNEALVVTDVLPWLHPVARVELLAKQDVVIGALRVNLGALPADAPVFGPNTMHMYSREVAGTGCLYAGRVLLTFQVTELVEGVRSGLIIPPLEDEAVGKVQLLLVGEVRDAVVLDEEMSGQSLRLEVSLGEAGCNRPHGFASGDRSSSSACLYPIKNNRVGTSHTYLSCNRDDGTVYRKTEWADSLYRLHRTNHLENITKNVESFVDSLSAKVDQNKSDFNMTLKNGLKKLCDDCHSYLAVHSNRLPIGNQLDRWRQTLRVDELILIKQEADALIVTSKPVPRECLCWARKTLERLKFLIEDPQHSLPDVLLSLWMGNSRFANCRIKARRVLHSDVSHERGTVCGVVSSLMLKGTNSGKTVAVVDLKLWLGRLAVWDSSHKWEHFALSPFWHEEFSLVAVVCQGYAMNSKVLQNSYVTVSVRQHSKRTQCVCRSIPEAGNPYGMRHCGSTISGLRTCLPRWYLNCGPEALL